MTPDLLEKVTLADLAMVLHFAITGPDAELDAEIAGVIPELTDLERHELARGLRDLRFHRSMPIGSGVQIAVHERSTVHTNPAPIERTTP